MRIQNISLTLPIAFALLGTQSAKSEPPAPPPVVEASGIARTERDVPVPQNKSGVQLSDRLTKILSLTGWFENLKVTSQDGLVTLSGRVEDASQRDWAMKLAQDTEGVVAVIDKIELKDMGWFELDPTKKELKALWKSFLAFVPHLVMSLIILAFCIFLYRVLSKYYRKFWSGRLSNPMISDLMGKIGALPVLLIGLYIVLQVLGLTGLAFSVLGGTGALGLVAGFAFKNILENYFSGLMLSVRRPFVVGDLIDVAGQSGTVFSLSSRGTTLVDSDGNHILIPNSTIFTSIIKNQSAGSLTRVHVQVDVHSDEPVDSVRSRVLAYLKKRPEIVTDPAAEAHRVVEGDKTHLDVSFWIRPRETDAKKLKQVVLSGVAGAPADGVAVKNDSQEVIERATKDSKDSSKNMLLEPDAPARAF